MSIIQPLGRAAIFIGGMACTSLPASATPPAPCIQVETPRAKQDPAGKQEPGRRADNDIDAWGKPDFESGNVHRAAIWRDDGGWHIRWTTAGVAHDFSGWIGAPGGEFTKVEMVGKEKKDWARVSPKERRIAFETHTTGGVDGFDFQFDGKELRFNLMMDGKEMALEQIHIGVTNQHPRKMPFVLDKWDAQPAK